MSRKFVVYVAVSADGYIARSDGSYDFLNRAASPGGYGMKAFLRSIDSILWGRKTWEQALMTGPANPFGPKIRNYVFSRGAAKGPEYVSESPAEFARRERGEPGKNLWIMGGGELIAALLEAKAVDEFILHTVPVMIGEGIPLLRTGPSTIGLTLLSARRYPDGVIRSHYRVEK
jgi:dihydrofolate reductase